MLPSGWGKSLQYHPQMTLETPRTACVNLAPVPGIWPYLPQIGQFFKVWVFPETHAGLCDPGADKTAKKHASLKTWPTAQKRQKDHQKLKEMVKNEKKYFLRKSAIFQPLMRGTAKQHGFLHIGANLVAKRGQIGQIHPISTCI